MVFDWPDTPAQEERRVNGSLQTSEGDEMFPGETILSGAPASHYTFEVLQSPAGFYIGTRDAMGPYSRESIYFGSERIAAEELQSWEELCFSSRDFDPRIVPDPRIALLREVYGWGGLRNARV